MFTSAFWNAAGERAVKTFAQTELALLTLSSQPIDVFHMNWVGVLSAGLGATLLSLLTSAAGLIPASSPTPAAAVAAEPKPAPAPAAAPVVEPQRPDAVMDVGPNAPVDPVDPSLEITDALRAVDQQAAQPVVVGAPPADLIPPAAAPAEQPSAS